MTGMPPATAASKLRATPAVSARPASVLPCLASSALLAVTTCLPASRAASTAFLAMPSSPPISSTNTSMEGSTARRSASSNHWALPIVSARFFERERAETATTSMWRPTCSASRPPCSASSCNNPVPTVPSPAMPSRSGLFMAARYATARPRTKQIRRLALPKPRHRLGYGSDDLGDAIANLVEVGVGGDKRRGNDQGIERHTRVDVEIVEHAFGGLRAVQSRFAGNGIEVNAGQQSHGANVGHARFVLEAHHGIPKCGLEPLGSFEQPFVLIDVERGKAGHGGQGMARVGVAVEELNHVLGAGHEGIVDLLRHHHARHRHGGVGDALGEGA